MLEYKSDKRDNIEFGSMRIPLFFTQQVQDYMKNYNFLVMDLVKQRELLNVPTITSDEFNNQEQIYNNKIQDIVEYKDWVITHLDDFTDTALELIEKYHSDEIDRYIKEFDVGINIIYHEVEQWAIPIEKPQQLMSYII